MPSRNVVASDDKDGEDRPNATSSGSYWGKTKRFKQVIIQRRFLYVKSKLASESYRKKYVHHKNYINKTPQTFFDMNHFVTSNSEGDYESKSYAYIQSEYVENLT